MTASRRPSPSRAAERGRDHMRSSDGSPHALVRFSQRPETIPSNQLVPQSPGVKLRWDNPGRQAAWLSGAACGIRKARCS